MLPDGYVRLTANEDVLGQLTYELRAHYVTTGQVLNVFYLDITDFERVHYRLRESGTIQYMNGSNVEDIIANTNSLQFNDVFVYKLLLPIEEYDDGTYFYLTPSPKVIRSADEFEFIAPKRRNWWQRLWRDDK